MTGVFSRILGRGGARREPLSYEESREIARDPDVKVRRSLAERTDVRPEILYFLAEDKAPEVRRVIAVNEATPSKANLLLARDCDDDVRCDLALKISRLAPELSDNERDRVRQVTLEVLEILAQDQLVKVRRILAETLKDVAHAPRHVIQSLANDAELVVAAPVLQFSPLLTEDDLLEIIASSSVTGKLSAISRRAGVPEAVADAIADTKESEAVTALLANPSAQIREETLDRLVEGARTEKPWQMPLAGRPLLPPGAVRKLAGFVTETVLGALMRRNDLDAETKEMVGKAVRARVDSAATATAAVADEGGEGESEATASKTGAAQSKDGRKDPSRKHMAEYVQRLYAQNQLTDEKISEALDTGDRSFVAHALALKAGLPVSVINRIAAARSPKAVTALAWKAGLKMRFAIRLQARFGGVPAAEILPARDGIDFPLTEEDMNWQLEFFAGSP